MKETADSQAEGGKEGGENNTVNPTALALY